MKLPFIAEFKDQFNNRFEQNMCVIMSNKKITRNYYFNLAYFHALRGALSYGKERNLLLVNLNFNEMVDMKESEDGEANE